VTPHRSTHPRFASTSPSLTSRHYALYTASPLLTRLTWVCSSPITQLLNAAGMSKLHISTADTESIWHTWSWRYSQVMCDWVSIASLQNNFVHCRLLDRQFLNWDLIVAFIPFNSQITMATVSPRIAEFHDFLRNEQLRLAGQQSTSRAPLAGRVHILELSEPPRVSLPDKDSKQFIRCRLP
jgi:hypothetical protein